MKRFSNVLFVAEPEVDNIAALDQAITLTGNNQGQLTVAGTVELGNSVTAQNFRNALILEREQQLQDLVRERSIANVPIDTKSLLVDHSLKSSVK